MPFPLALALQALSQVPVQLSWSLFRDTKPLPKPSLPQAVQNMTQELCFCTGAAEPLIPPPHMTWAPNMGLAASVVASGCPKLAQVEQFHYYFQYQPDFKTKNVLQVLFCSEAQAGRHIHNPELFSAN